MARRIRWQILIAAISSLLVLGLMGYLALRTVAVSHPLAGGDYVEGLVATPQQLNPLAGDTANDPAGADIQALIFDGLMRIGPDGLPEQALAESWDISDNGTVYTFTLRADVTWHDGTPLSADDVLFTLRAVRNRGFAGNPSAGALWSNVLVEKISARSVRCTLASPYAPFLSQATFPMLPAHILGDIPPEEWASAPFSHAPVGTGPYQLAELTPERALLKANSRYFGGRPFLDSIEFRFFRDSSAALAALTRGEIMGLGFSSTSDLGQTNLPRTAVRDVLPLDSYTTLTFNLRNEPLSNLQLRRALAHGLDKDQLIAQALGNRAARLDTPILPGWWAAAEDPQWYIYNPQQAASDLTTLGWELGADGVRQKSGQQLVLPLITDEAPDRLAAAQSIATQWGALGAKVEVQQLDGQTLAKRLQDHDFVLALHGWQRLGPDPDVYSLWHSSRSTRGENYAGLNDQQIDELLDNARHDLDIPARSASYAAFQQRWVELAPSITLYQPQFVYATSRQLEGLGFDTATAEQNQAESPPPNLASAHLLLGREDRFRNVVHWFVRSAREIRGNLRQK
jgi:peptide/nickel transport system substrate-binding protein